ncbi:MAG: hypothetical protein JST39_17630 [Bacteroidetes bacterium]|nr:hypothetical protein [Bacteroidota bacterium]
MGKVLKEKQERPYPVIDLSAYPSLLISESDRTQLLQKLHDGMGQMIAALNMQISTVRKSQAENPVLEESLQHSLNLLKEMNREYRDLCQFLLPPPPEHPGIEEAFRMLCSHVRNSRDLSVVFRNHNFAGALDPAVALGVYRILQELMNYTLAQPGCTGIEAGLWHQEKNLHFFIRGTGEVPEEQKGQSYRMSLPESLFIKTEQLGGRLHVDVVKPASTNVLLVIPCPKNEI